jgi:hypothetical protein
MRELVGSNGLQNRAMLHRSYFSGFWGFSGLS